MNPKVLPPLNAPLFLMAAEQAQSQNAQFAADFQELCSRAMDQAMGIEKASLAALAGLQTCAIDIYQSSSWLSPAVGKLFEAAVQAIASCIELQLSWLALLAPHAMAHGTSHGMSQAGRTAADNSGNQAAAIADELAYSMDIAIGERFTVPVSRIAPISVRQDHPAEEETALAAAAA